MFEFGKDLRRLFSQARDGEDRAWLELISADLLEIEARQQATDAGRVSCARPAHAWLRAAVLWTEHARRTGQRLSATKALTCADHARREATDDETRFDADIAAAQMWLADHDLRGSPGSLEKAEQIIATATPPRRALPLARAAVIHALIRSRHARACGATAGRLDAAALLDSALHAAKAHPALRVEHDEVQLERAALTLEGGVMTRDARLLDQAGRDLRALVSSCAPDDRPITRARALTLCAVGLGALAALADDAGAREQAAMLFEAAADSFTPDHSPLDWIATLLARPALPAPKAAELQLARRLSQGEGLILGAMVRLRQLTLAIDAASARADDARLMALEAELFGRMINHGGSNEPLEWAVDQIAMSECRLARRRIDRTVDIDGLAIALAEAADLANDHGCQDIALRAATLNAAVRTPLRSI